MTNNRIATITIIAAVVLFISSLTQKSYCTDQCGDTILIFLLGWMGMLLEFGTFASVVIDVVQGKGFSIGSPVGATFTWLANPLLFLSFIALKRNYKVAIKLSLTSTALMFSFLLFGRILDNEAGTYAKITEYKAGYWLWLSSSIVILIGAIIMTRNNRGQDLNPITSVSDNSRFRT